MTSPIKYLLLFGSLFCGMASFAPAALADSITFFEDQYYDGHSFTVDSAGEISNLRDKRLGSFGDFNDDISSILISGNFKLTVYEDRNFGGRSVTIYLSRPYLDLLSSISWDNRISSIKWYPLSPVDEQPEAIFYDQANFRGNSFYIKGNGSVYKLNDKRRGSSSKNWNDQIRSVKIFGQNTLVVLYKDSKYRGATYSITKDAAVLKGFNAVASSLKVFD